MGRWIMMGYYTGNEFFVGGNEQSRNRPMWIIARDFNKESLKQNGRHAKRVRRQVESYQRVLG